MACQVCNFVNNTHGFLYNQNALIYAGHMYTYNKEHATRGELQILKTLNVTLMSPPSPRIVSSSWSATTSVRVILTTLPIQLNHPSVRQQKMLQHVATYSLYKWTRREKVSPMDVTTPFRFSIVHTQQLNNPLPRLEIVSEPPIWLRVTDIYFW